MKLHKMKREDARFMLKTVAWLALCLALAAFCGGMLEGGTLQENLIGAGIFFLATLAVIAGTIYSMDGMVNG